MMLRFWWWVTDVCSQIGWDWGWRWAVEQSTKAYGEPVVCPGCHADGDEAASQARAGGAK
jgi:hypothetical protein